MMTGDSRQPQRPSRKGGVGSRHVHVNMYRICIVGTGALVWDWNGGFQP